MYLLNEKLFLSTMTLRIIRLLYLYVMAFFIFVNDMKIMPQTILNAYLNTLLIPARC